MGAGVLPFALADGDVVFLMQTVFEGRKSGLLNDFGGGSEPGESGINTAAREFIEETETLYFADNPAVARRTPESVMAQLPVVQSLFNDTLSRQPGWLCRRISPNPDKPKDWTTYFIHIPYRDVEALNRLWQSDGGARYKKRRRLLWISASELVSLFHDHPHRLWKRVRQLDDAISVITEIRDTFGKR
jgi:8-oxo-dGTP pyrophosphatase MutT (NUDIX family)